MTHRQKNQELLHKQYANKLENLEETDVLDRYNLPRWSHYDAENLHSSVTKTETDSIIKTLSTNKSLGLDCFTAKFYKLSKK